MRVLIYHQSPHLVLSAFCQLRGCHMPTRLWLWHLQLHSSECKLARAKKAHTGQSVNWLPITCSIPFPQLSLEVKELFLSIFFPACILFFFLFTSDVPLTPFTTSTRPACNETLIVNQSLLLHVAQHYNKPLIVKAGSKHLHYTSFFWQMA